MPPARVASGRQATGKTIMHDANIPPASPTIREATADDIDVVWAFVRKKAAFDDWLARGHGAQSPDLQLRVGWY